MRKRAPGLTVVTPWLDHPELIPEYEHAVRGASVVVVDNGSSEGVHHALWQMTHRLGGVLVTNPGNRWFAAAVNQGLDLVRTECAVILNNDIAGGPAWVDQALVDIMGDTEVLHGPSLQVRSVDGLQVPYLEGWCIGAHMDAWCVLGGLDEVHFPLPYWEDNDLCLRAVLTGFYLNQTTWGLVHKTNATMRGMREARAGVGANQAEFERRVRDARGSLPVAAGGD